MTREQMEILVKNHNEGIDNFMNDTLPILLEMTGVKVTRKENGEFEIPAGEWFKAQKFIKAMNFYKSGMAIVNECRKNGFDVKINMQSEKIVF